MGSSHVRSELLCGSSDIEIWTYARENYFTIVSKDSDFDNLAVLFGRPPKVLSIRLGNCTTASVEILIRSSIDRILQFEDNENEVVLILP